jgi:hypothetical protein
MAGRKIEWPEAEYLSGEEWARQEISKREQEDFKREIVRRAAESLGFKFGFGEIEVTRISRAGGETWKERIENILRDAEEQGGGISWASHKDDFIEQLEEEENLANFKKEIGKVKPAEGRRPVEVSESEKKEQFKRAVVRKALDNELFIACMMAAEGETWEEIFDEAVKIAEKQGEKIIKSMEADPYMESAERGSRRGAIIQARLQKEKRQEILEKLKAAEEELKEQPEASEAEAA